MTDDILREAAEALRDEGSAPAQGARFTRGRVLASLRQRRKSRTRTIKVLVPLAAVLVGGTTWAAAGGPLPERWLAAIGLDESEPQDGPIAQVKSPTPPGRAPQPAPMEPEEPDVPEPREEVEPEPEAPADDAVPTPLVNDGVGPVPGAGPADAMARTKTDAPEPPPERSRALALYRVAHRKHFVDQDPAGALAAWDAYLTAEPAGRFSVEARYNRALCLVRLGRTAQAKAALQPFANGRFGNYRQEEAQRLVDALSGKKDSQPD